MPSQAIGDHEGRGNGLGNSEGGRDQNRPVVLDDLSSKHHIADQPEAREQDADDHQRPRGDVDERPMITVGDLGVSVERHAVLLRAPSEGASIMRPVNFPTRRVSSIAHYLSAARSLVPLGNSNQAR